MDFFYHNKTPIETKTTPRKNAEKELFLLKNRISANVLDGKIKNKRIAIFSRNDICFFVVFGVFFLYLARFGCAKRIFCNIRVDFINVLIYNC